MMTDTHQSIPNPDEKTTAELRRVFTGMQDALTDEMISRLAETLSSGAKLLDKLGRSELDKTLPLLAGMIANGDLARVAQLARVLGAVQDSVTDEMIVRLGDVISGTLAMLDRLNRTHLVDDIATCFEEAAQRTENVASPGGGLGGLWTIARNPDNQEAIRYLLHVSRAFCACRSNRKTAGSL